MVALDLERAYPKKLSKQSSNSLGNVYDLDYLIVSVRILDRKCDFTTVYSCEKIDLGRKHLETKEAVTKQKIIHSYNKFMGGNFIFLHVLGKQ